MTTDNTITTRTLHRLQDVERRTADRSHEPGGAMLLAVYDHRPDLDELATPDEAGHVYGPRSRRALFGEISREYADDVDPGGRIRAQGRAMGEAYRRVFGTYAALGEGLAAGFRGERIVPDVGEGIVPPPDTSRPATAEELDRIADVLAEDEEGRR